MKIRNLFLNALLGIGIAETFVRLTWDEKKGTPGLALAHPTRVEVLAPNYEGWFEGQPLKINSLGFRDDREYSIEKKRIPFE